MLATATPKVARLLDGFATESAFLAVLFAFNLLSTLQARVMPEKGYRQPTTLRAAVFLGGAILGGEGHQQVLRISADLGGVEKFKALIERALKSTGPLAPLLPNPKLLSHQPIRVDPWKQPEIDPGGCEI
jgi:hypothetical protein